jgi:hypothetical protein
MFKFVIFFFLSCFPWITWSSEWHCMTVDSAGSEQYALALALDSRGYPHIVYSKPYFGTMYASWDGSTWCVGALSDSLRNLTYKKDGRSSYALIIDNKDYPHIVISGQYIWKDEDGWHKTDCVAGGYLSIGFDSKGYLHISSDCSGYEYSYLKYIYQNAQGWHNECVEALGFNSGTSSIVINDNDIPYIAYNADHTPTQYGLFLAKRDSVLGWLFEAIIDTVQYAHPSMELDNFDNPHIAYSVIDYGQHLKYAVKRNEAWHIETVDTLSGASMVSLALDQDNCPHVSYKGNKYWLKYAQWDGAWNIEKVDSMFGSGSIFGRPTTSIAVDKEGYAHIAYCQQLVTDINNLRYATNRPSPKRAKAYFLKEKK